MAGKVTLNGQLLHPSDYLSAVEFRGKDVTLTITKVFIDTLKMKGGASEQKPVLTFGGTEKKLVLNKTNAASIAVMYGDKAESWVGKRVTFYPSKTQCGRDMVDCIRVREKVPAAATTAQGAGKGRNQPATPPDAGDAANGTQADSDGGLDLQGISNLMEGDGNG